jgi:protein-disulfide isomerase
MKRRTIFIAVFVLAILAATALIISKRNNVDNSLTAKNSLSESESLLVGNNPAINGASAQVNATVPAISTTDQLLFGVKDATLKMVVYEDLTNPYSLSYNEILKQAEKEFTGKLAIYVRPYFEANNDLALSYQAALVCAGSEGQFSELRSLIIEQKPLSEEAIVDGTKKLSLNGAKFSQCLSDTDLKAKITRSVEDIRMIAIYGAPTSILEGEIITGARALADIKNGEGENVEGLKSIITRHLSGK